MANPEHLSRVQHVDTWNDWRRQRPYEVPDLSGANLVDQDLAGVNLSPAETNLAYLWAREDDLTKVDLRTEAKLNGTYLHDTRLDDADLRRADLSQAKLKGATLARANLREANLAEANLYEALLPEATLALANLRGAVLTKANLTGADLSDAILADADLSLATLDRANLDRADLSRAQLYRTRFRETTLKGALLQDARFDHTDFTGAILGHATIYRASLVNCQLDRVDLTGCRVYGISMWDTSTVGAIQRDLIITPPGEPDITTDSLAVAQLLYWLKNNENVRDLIVSTSAKLVLLLGRFSDTGLRTLRALRDELRERNYLPVLFTFGEPEQRTGLETVVTLAHLAKFIIADLTDAHTVLGELIEIVPHLPSVPVQPIWLENSEEPWLFGSLQRRESVLTPISYSNSNLSTKLASAIEAAERKADELTRKFRPAPPR